MYAPLQRIELHRKLRPLLIDWSRHDQWQLEARSFIMKFRLSMSFPWAFFSLWVTLWYKAINFVSKRATTWARPRNNFNDRNLRKAVRQETLEIMALLLMPLKKRGERSEFQFFVLCYASIEITRLLNFWKSPKTRGSKNKNSHIQSKGISVTHHHVRIDESNSFTKFFFHLWPLWWP